MTLRSSKSLLQTHGRAALLAVLCTMAACGDSEKARKSQAKQARDAKLLAMEYPAAQGPLPTSITIAHDEATNRTRTVLTLSAGAWTMLLTSEHKGRARAADDPEGSVDGLMTVRGLNSGALAFSGAPGDVSIDGSLRPLKDPSGKDSGYTAKPGLEEVRFRLTTPDLIAAANAASVAFTFGTYKTDLSASHVRDLREFAARLRPGGTGGE